TGTAARKHWEPCSAQTCTAPHECDAVELRGAHAPDEADALQPGQRAVIGPDVLAVPSHATIRTLVRFYVNPEQNAAAAGLVTNTPAASGLSFKVDHRDV